MIPRIRHAGKNTPPVPHPGGHPTPAPGRRDDDNDQTLTRPRAWHRAKTAFGPTTLRIQDLMTALEGVADAEGRHTRHLFAAALFDLLRRTPGERTAALLDFYAWMDRADPIVLARPIPDDSVA